MGKDKPQLVEGMGLWNFVDTLALDLKMLSRAESTWKQYAAWYTLFVEWGDIMGVDVEHGEVSLGMLANVLIRSLVMMWLGSDYAASTMGGSSPTTEYRVRHAPKTWQLTGTTSAQTSTRDQNARTRVSFEQKSTNLLVKPCF